ncbi:MAG: Gfo/Idh/MocA family oxidoreductase [Acidimicrobiia bacterium]|nr:Gfo/Idh/MocA family oxidoreductase [Acidimicrobiia bacterium]
MSDRVKVAVVGAGVFGENHLRVICQSQNAELVAVADIEAQRREQAAARYGCRAVADWSELKGHVQAAVLATPTVTHADLGCRLLQSGIDLLVEKPLAASNQEAEALCRTAAAHGRILQVGHLERFNPAVMALGKLVTLPLFFEIHRMSVFAPRSLDVDVVLDLMIHDLDIVLHLVGKTPEEVRAAGIRILSEKVDIANVRLAFPGGCVANMTASRVSTEKVRKLRLFQPHQYISIDYARQDGVVFTVGENRGIGFQPLAAEKREPLAAQLDAFLEAVRSRSRPHVSGEDAARTLAVALQILDGIQRHGQIVQETLTSLDRTTS